jgi:Tfp pilus assembly protein PilF
VGKQSEEFAPGNFSSETEVRNMSGCVGIMLVAAYWTVWQQTCPGQAPEKPVAQLAGETRPSQPERIGAGQAESKQSPSARPSDLPAQLPMSKLKPARLQPGLSVLHYRISTSSPLCQQFFDQGLAYLYSYVWMEAVRNFETALQYDKESAITWWALSRAFEAWGKQKESRQALEKAWELRHLASPSEQLLIQARAQEKGLLPELTTPEARRQAAINTIDQLLSLHEEDEEAWFYRAQLACGGRLFGGNVNAVPFYKALLRINPLHPGANHELVHYYENARQPALGWAASENYIASSPGIPHAWHMQAHLATRLGRWDRANASSSRAVALQHAYHRDMEVRPAEDHQYVHHVEVLAISLVHDGRFREARQLRDLPGITNKNAPVWFRLMLASGDYTSARKIAEANRRTDKVLGAYQSALTALACDDLAQAEAEIHVLQQAWQETRSRSDLRLKLLETRGIYLCRLAARQPHGLVSPSAGLALLEQAVRITQDDYRHHAWGNGAYYMEIWGTEALRLGQWDIAEEAFLEALAHDSGSVRAALGLAYLKEEQGDRLLAERYHQLARRFWSQADAGHLERLQQHYRELAQQGRALVSPSQGATP